MAKARAALKAIDEGRIQPVYVLFGSEGYLRQAIIDALKKQLISADWEDMNFLQFEGDDPEAFQLTRTPLFGGSKRLLVLERSQLLGGTGRRGQGERVEAMRRSLFGYLDRPAADCCLVFDCLAEKADRRLKLVKRLSKEGLLIECNSLTSAEAVDWSVALAKRSGKRLDRQAAAYIVEGNSRRLRDIKNEVDKLILFVGDKKNIGLEEARQVGSARAAVIFDLTEALMAQRSHEASSAMHLLLQQGEAPPLILFMLARQFRLLWAAKAQGPRSSDLAGLPRFVVERLVKAAHSTAWAHLEEAFSILVELDYTIKTGRGDPARALELAVLRLSTVAQRPG